MDETPRLALGLALGVNGFGGVFNMRRKTSSSDGDFDMPQPLKTLCKGPHEVYFSLEKIDPKLAVLALNVINEASVADATYAKFLVIYTHGKAKPVFDYFNSLNGDGQKQAVMNALAASYLSSQRLILFNAVSKVFRAAQGLRNPIAHGFLCYCPKVPDALLFLDPKLWLSHQGQMDAVTAKVRAAYAAKDEAAIRAAIAESEEAKFVYLADAMAYKEKDFTNISRDIVVAKDLMLDLDNVFSFDAVNAAEGERLAGLLIQKPALQSLFATGHPVPTARQ